MDSEFAAASHAAPPKTHAAFEAFRALEEQMERNREDAAFQKQHSHHHHHHDDGFFEGSGGGRGRKGTSAPRKRRRDEEGIGGTTINLALGGATAAAAAAEPDYGEDDDVENVAFLAKRREILHSDEACFGCEHGFGSSVQSKEFPEFENMWEYYNREMTHIAYPALAETLHKQFNHFIRAPRMRAGIVVPDWPASMILVHLRTHIRTPKATLYDSIDTVSTMIEAVKEDIFKKKKTTEKNLVEYEPIKMYVTLERLKQSLLQTTPEKYVAYANTSALE